MTQLIRSDSDNADFRALVGLLDQDLQVRYGEEQAFFDQFNKLDKIQHAIVVYSQEQAVACGAIKAYDEQTMEVKRMFVHPEFRAQGFAKLVLQELELWASELGYTTCVLETGNQQPEAIGLYQRIGYKIIPNYGQYMGVKSSVCMRKSIFK